MKIPTVNNCCCGVSLLTAGRILGVLTIVSAIIKILLGDRIIVHIVVIGLGAAWLYGVEKQNTTLMLPIIIIEAVGLVLIVLTAFFILIFGQKTEVIRLEGNTIEEEEISPVAIAVAMIILAIFGAYFLIVKYSLYKLMKDDGQNTLPEHNIPPKNEV